MVTIDTTTQRPAGWVPPEFLEQLADLVRERQSLHAEEDRLDSMVSELRAVAQRAGSRGDVAEIPAPVGTGMVALATCAAATRSLEDRVDELRRAGLEGA